MLQLVQPDAYKYCILFQYSIFQSFKERLKDSCQALVQLELWIAIDRYLNATKHQTQDGFIMQKFTTLRKEFNLTVNNLCLVNFGTIYIHTSTPNYV